MTRLESIKQVIINDKNRKLRWKNGFPEAWMRKTYLLYKDGSRRDTSKLKIFHLLTFK